MTEVPDQQLRDEWGNRASPTGLENISDRAYFNGTVPPYVEGYYILTSIGWVLLGGIAAGVTSIAQGNGITCTPNPIIALGIVSARYGDTATDVPLGSHTHTGLGGGAGLILPPTSMTDPGTLNAANTLIDDHVRDPTIHNIAALQEYMTPERPDAFHFIKNIAYPHDRRTETGFGSQRNYVYSQTYSNKYYLYTDADALISGPLVQLRIEHHDALIGTKTPLSRCVWDVMVNISDYLTNPIAQINPADMCLVIDDQDQLHLIFIADDNTHPATKGVYDAYIPIANHAALQVPPYADGVPPPPLITINVQAELVNTYHLSDCSHPSAAFSPNYGSIQGSVCIVWKQTDAAGTQLQTNSYDPAGVAGLRYTTLIPGGQIGISNPGLTVNFATIEFGVNNAYLLYDEGGGSKFATSPNTVLGVLTWNTMAAGISLDASITGVPSTMTDPVTMCIANYTTNNRDICFAVMRNGDGVQGEKILVIIFGNFLTSGIGAAYNCSIYDTYTAYSPHETNGRSFFQLGISHISWSNTGYAPVLFLLHYDKDGTDFGVNNLNTFSVLMTLMIPDLVAGIIPSTIPISPRAATYYDGVVNHAELSPKVHFAFYQYNRPWHHSTLRVYRYYPWMIFAKIEVGYEQTSQGGNLYPVLSLWSKDSPEYPYKDNVATY